MTEQSNAARDASEVLWSHLQLAKEGSVEDDLTENFARDVIVLTRWGSFHGRDGLQQLADRLARELPDAAFVYDEVLVERDFGFLAWSATASNGNRVDDGADSYVIRNGRIVAQSIHYTLRTASE